MVKTILNNRAVASLPRNGTGQGGQSIKARIPWGKYRAGIPKIQVTLAERRPHGIITGV